MTTRAEFVATVETYTGTPYVHQGRLPGVGMDCPAPALLAARAHGLVAPDFDITGYSREADGKALQAFCEQVMLRVEEPRLADVLLCGFLGGPARHLGVLVDATPGRMYWVHAEGYRFKRVMRSRLVFGRRYMQLIAAYHVPGVAWEVE